MRKLVACLCLAVACFGCASLGVSEEEYRECEDVCYTWQSLAIECGADDLVACDLDECVDFILSEHNPVWCRHVEMMPASCEAVSLYSATPLFPLQCSVTSE